MKMNAAALKSRRFFGEKPITNVIKSNAINAMTYANGRFVAGSYVGRIAYADW